MELHPFKRQSAVTQRHDGFVAGTRFDRCGGDLKLLRQALLRDDQGMVAGTGHIGRDAGEDRPAIVLHRAGFAVHQLFSTDHFAAECGSERLMAETDAENGNSASTGLLACCKVAQQGDADACILRGAGAGGDEDALGIHRRDLFGCHLIVAADHHFGTQLAHVLDKVVGERVVVVEHKDHSETILRRGNILQKARL